MDKKDVSEILVEQVESHNSDSTKKTEVSKMELFKECLYEAIATFLFSMIIAFCSADVNKFSFGFFVILVIFEKCSGPHLNPCFTTAFMVYNKKFNSNGMLQIILLILSQLVGATLGALLSILVDDDNLVFTKVQDDMGILSIIFTEFFFTSTLIFVILFVVSDITKPSNDTISNCAIIICWFYMIVNAGASISGASYNPALLIVFNSIAYFWGHKDALNYVPYMVIAELVGGFLAALIFKYVYEPYYAYKHRVIKERKTKFSPGNSVDKPSLN
jgi:glycerol uptake facilitator-like aquaporin